MNRIRIYLVQLPAPARDVALEAAHSAFAVADITELASTRGIPFVPSGDRAEILIIAASSPEFDEALRALTPLGEPRWAVVALGRDVPAPAVCISVAEWNAALLTRVVRHAHAEHELRRQNQRLRGDLRTIARRVGHDLRSPLGCVHTSADVLKELSPTDAETILSMAAMIQESSGEIALIVERIIAVLLATADAFVPERVEMGDIVHNAVHQLDTVIESARSDITLPLAWPEVRGTPSWLGIIWINLLGNALRHSGPAPQIEVGWNLVADGVRFTVTDHGPGVPAARLDGLFARFERLHSLRTPGFGLSIVQRLVELQGGTCGHEKPAAGGACFYFILPSP